MHKGATGLPVTFVVENIMLKSFYDLHPDIITIRE